jgi:hypothetical protein
MIPLIPVPATWAKIVVAQITERTRQQSFDMQAVFEKESYHRALPPKFACQLALTDAAEPDFHLPH